MIYEYNLTDHLGNTRITFGDSDADGDADILQEDHYYPFGMLMTMTSSPSAAPPNNYLYNGKELQDELDLGWYDYGARMYDASIGRWNGVDAMGEKYGAWSPFNYVMGNPIRLVDPDGNVVADYYDKKGNFIRSDGNESDTRNFIVLKNKDAKSVSKGSYDVDSKHELPSVLALNTARKVLSDTYANGGKREESAIVMKNGEVLRGPTGPEPRVESNGMLRSESDLPSLPEGSTNDDVEVSIHSHGIETIEKGGFIFNPAANVPSPDHDAINFRKFETNIIVGKLGEVTENSPPDFAKMRSSGIVIYGRTTDPVLSIETPVLDKILTRENGN